jgi:hypothetical protein
MNIHEYQQNPLKSNTGHTDHKPLWHNNKAYQILVQQLIHAISQNMAMLKKHS